MGDGHIEAEGIDRGELLTRVDAQRRLLEAILRQLPDAVLAVDAAEGRVIAASEQLVSLFGVRLAHGQRFAEPEDFAVFHGYHPEGTLYRPEEWPPARALFGGETVRAEEIEVLRQDGSRVSVRMSSSPVRDEHGQVVAVVAVAHRAESALLGRVLSVMGHDLRNPLHAITTIAYLLGKQSGVTEEVARGLGRIERNARRMARMITDLLDFTRSRVRGGVQLDAVPADLCALARRAVAELKKAAASRVIELRCEAECTGAWDPDRLLLAVSNLLSNAIEYGDPEAPVRVTVDASEAEAILTVHNSGEPIAADELPGLFEPFQKPRRERGVGASGGLGLGLYLAKEIVIAHGGTLTVRSDTAAGTTFTVRLPRRAPGSIEPAAR